MTTALKISREIGIDEIHRLIAGVDLLGRAVVLHWRKQAQIEQKSITIEAHGRILGGTLTLRFEFDGGPNGRNALADEDEKREGEE